MKLSKDIIVVLCLLALVTVSLVGCSKKGEAEKAGEKIDQAMDSAKDKLKDITK
ncbi:MAG: hypothetical protein OEV73_11375 [Desulfobulbaceae bacterium]|nr:hypothetical protein [Desulfobulbaceae bacterium]